VWTDDQGRRHVVGMVLLTLPPADAASTQVLRVRSFGLALARTPHTGSAAVVGWSDITQAAVADDHRFGKAASASVPRREE
jgi:hypothetical protein